MRTEKRERVVKVASNSTLVKSRCKQNLTLLFQTWGCLNTHFKKRDK